MNKTDLNKLIQSIQDAYGVCGFAAAPRGFWADVDEQCLNELTHIGDRTYLRGYECIERDYIKDTVYLIPRAEPTIKVVTDDVRIESDPEDPMMLNIYRPLTLTELADAFGMTVNELMNTKFGMWTDEEKENERME